MCRGFEPDWVHTLKSIAGYECPVFFLLCCMGGDRQRREITNLEINHNLSRVLEAQDNGPFNRLLGRLHAIPAIEREIEQVLRMRKVTCEHVSVTAERLHRLEQHNLKSLECR